MDRVPEERHSAGLAGRGDRRLQQTDALIPGKFEAISKSMPARVCRAFDRTQPVTFVLADCGAGMSGYGCQQIAVCCGELVVQLA